MFPFLIEGNIYSYAFLLKFKYFYGNIEIQEK